MIWHRKKRNFLLIFEIFFSFLVLFAVATMAISDTIKYFTPLGFSYENVWLLRVSWSRLSDNQQAVDISEKLVRIQQEMEACNEIEKVGWATFNHPYSSSRAVYSLDWNGQEIDADVYDADDNFAEVMNIPLIEGRWFGAEDDALPVKPVVINSQLREVMFGNEAVIGQIFNSGKHEFKIVGVIDRYYYRGEFNGSNQGFFRRASIRDTIVSRLPDVVMFNVRPGTDIQFEERLTKRLALIAPDWIFRIETLEDMRTSYLKEYMLGLGIFGVVAGFLVFNVALGLFGVLWYSINRRRREVGLRRAVGANASQVSGQILGESLVLATFAVIAGTFIAAQVPLLGLDTSLTGMDSSIPGTIYLFGMACAGLMIYLLVSLCALYPSRLAARIHPAQALHDE
jgi:putative ABC transport system permease protein